MGFICGDKQLRVNVVIYYAEVKTIQSEKQTTDFDYANKLRD
jgi:hypothetical protein